MVPVLKWRMTQKQSFVIFASLCFIWGTTWLAIRVTVAELSPLTGASLRFILATICVLLYARYKRISLSLPSRTLYFWMILCALLTYVIDYGLIYWAEQYLSAGVTAIFFATFPLFTALFGFWLLPDRELSSGGTLGVVLGFAGVIIVFLDQLLSTRFEKTVLLASLAIILAAMAAALSTVLVKKVATGISSAAVTFHQLIWGTFGLLLLAIIFEPLPAHIPEITTISAIIYLGIIGTALTFILYYRLLQDKTAASMSTIGYITPLVAVIIDFFIFGYLLPIRTWLGLLIVFSGIYLINKKPKQIIQKEQI